MTYKIKGFVAYPGFADNAADVTAPVGELSSYAWTFARDIKSYSDAQTGASVLVFTSNSDTSGKMAVPTVMITQLSAIAAWVKTRQQAVVGADTKTAFLSDFTANFGTTCTNVAVSQMVVGPAGKLWPSDVSWSDSSYVTEPTTCRLWFSDAVFRVQYDDYEIVVVPPMPVDNLFGDYTAVSTAVNAINFITKINAVQSARSSYPETVLASQTYALVNTLNPSVSTPTDWSFLIYGPRGNDQDLIRQAVLDYIAAHSTHTVQEWQQYLPDIFKSLEFLLIPDWANYAVAPLTNTAGVNSPVIKLGALITRLKAVLPTLNQTHIQNTAHAIVHPYKYLAVGVVGNPDNRDGKFYLTDVFPDLITAPSTSTDFGRMNLNTQGFMSRLADMMPIAETLTQAVDVPVAFRKVLRNGILYISCNYNGATFLVSSKASTPV